MAAGEDGAGADIRARRLALMFEQVDSLRGLVARLVRDAVVIAVLVHAGYRGWRLGAVIGLLLSIAVVPTLMRRTLRRGNFALAGFTVALIAQILAAGTMALTGGMASPILPGVAAMVLLPAKMYGSERHADLLSILLVLSIAALALVPPEVTGPPLPLGDHVVILVVTFAWAYLVARTVMVRIRDLTDAADREVLRLREAQVADAEAGTRRLQDVGARVAHELKNPLAAIKGLVQLVVRGLAPPRAARLDGVLAEIDRVESTVRAYLSFARPVGDAPAPAPAPTIDDLRRQRDQGMRASGKPLVRRVQVLAIGLVAGQLVLFGLGGMSTTRLLLVGGTFFAFVGLQRLMLAIATARARPAVLPFPFATANISGQLWIAASITLTGGARSPLLAVVAANLVMTSVFEVIGIARAWRLAALMLALVTAVSFLPPSITGPALVTWEFDAITVLSLVWAVLMIRVFTTTIAAASDRAAAAVAEVRAARLRDAEALTARLRQVAARVADELSAPLAAKHAAITAELAGTDEPRPRERLAVVAREIARIQIIVAEYLSATRPLEDLAPEAVDLAALVGESAAVVAGRAEHGQVAVELRTAGATLVADPRRLREALLNVLSNALDATPAGGTVRVETAATDGGGATLTVVDSGRGMSPELLARLGQSFFTTRADGTGLGVVLVQGVVAQHGGTIAYASEPGRGTRVTITLPPRPPS